MLDTVYRVVGVCRGIVVLLLVFWVRELWLCVLLAGWREVGVMKTEAGYVLWAKTIGVGNGMLLSRYGYGGYEM